LLAFAVGPVLVTRFAASGSGDGLAEAMESAGCGPSAASAEALLAVRMFLVRPIAVPFLDLPGMRSECMRAMPPAPTHWI
jgi:hypothetical protein